MSFSKKQGLAVGIILLLGFVIFMSKMVVWKSPYEMTGWENALFSAVEGCDEISVYKVGSDDLIITSHDEAMIRSFFGAVDIDESVHEFVMMPGRLRIAFKNDSEVMSAIELVGSNHLRWRSGKWPSDAKLTKSSSVDLQKWLVDVGVNAK